VSPSRFEAALTRLARRPDSAPGWPAAGRDQALPRVRAMAALALPPRAAVTFALTPIPAMWIAEVAVRTPIDATGGQGWVRPWTSLLWLVLDRLDTDGSLPPPGLAAADWLTEAAVPIAAARPRQRALFERATGIAPSDDWVSPLRRKPTASASPPTPGGQERVYRKALGSTARRPTAFGGRLPDPWADQLLDASVDDRAWRAAGARDELGALGAARFVHDRWLPSLLLAEGDPTAARSLTGVRVRTDQIAALRRADLPLARRVALVRAGFTAAEVLAADVEQLSDDDLDVLAGLSGAG
jgi:hypothetical protein